MSNLVRSSTRCRRGSALIMALIVVVAVGVMLTGLTTLTLSGAKAATSPPPMGCGRVSTARRVLSPKLPEEIEELRHDPQASMIN